MAKIRILLQISVFSRFFCCFLSVKGGRGVSLTYINWEIAKLEKVFQELVKELRVFCKKSIFFFNSFEQQIFLGYFSIFWDISELFRAKIAEIHWVGITIRFQQPNGAIILECWNIIHNNCKLSVDLLDFFCCSFGFSSSLNSVI